MNIYEQALGNLTEDNWIKGQLHNNNNGRCIAGHVCYARYGQDMHWSQLPDLNNEDFALVLHKIVAEQYPDVVDAWLAGKPEDVVFSPIGLVTFFNDEHATYADVRAVLEKAASQ